MSALSALRALTEFDRDETINDALETFASYAPKLSTAELASATIEAVALISDARPEWQRAECEAAVCCVLREVERERPHARRRAA